MNFAENLEHAKNFAIETAMAAKDKAVQLASIAKANIAIYAEEDKIRKAQQQLGQLYYRDYAVGEVGACRVERPCSVSVRLLMLLRPVRGSAR